MNYSIQRSLAALAIIYCAVISCSKQEQPDNDISPELRTDSYVSWGMVDKHASDYRPKTKGANTNDVRITPYLGRQNDTLMYIVNYGNGDGWVVISTDTRTPAIIAKSDKGRFELEDGNIGLRLWMEGIANDMDIIRHAPDSQLTFTNKEIAAHKNYWADSPRGIVIPGHDDGDEGGHWHIWGRIEEEDYDSLTHMTPRWDQWAPYNKYCPQKSNGNGRVPAGCVAIAGSQMLYFLHEHLGVPQMMYANASLVGNQVTFSNWSTTAWDSMVSDYNSSSNRPCTEAVLIRYVGNLVGMSYGDGVSMAYTSVLPNNVFSPLGINATYSTYNDLTVKSSLLSGMPVIVGAQTSSGDIGHCFVIDGYKRTRTKSTTFYDWVPDWGHLPPGDPAHSSHAEVEYSSPHITYIQINWGWWTQWEYGLNDGWYALTGSWHTVNTSGSATDYDSDKYMITGFTIL